MLAFVPWSQQPPALGRNTKPSKVIAADHLARNLFEPVAGTHRDLVEAHRHVGNDIRKGVLVLPQLLEDIFAERGIVITSVAGTVRLSRFRMQQEHVLWIAYRERSQHHGIDDAENGRIRADPQRECQHNDQRK